MKIQKKINYDLIDILKFIFACCVVLIHTQFSKKIYCGFYIQEMIFRLAVPFFFIVSGYLSNRLTPKSLKKTLKKTIVIYTVWSLIYIFLDYFRYNLEYTFLFEQILRTILLSPSNIMWYSGSLIFSLIVIIHLGDDKKKLIYSIMLAFLLYIVGLMFNTYDFILSNDFFGELIFFLKKIFISNRNPLFCGYLFFSIGFFIGKYSIDYKIKIKNLILITIFLISIMTMESKLIYSNLDRLIEYDFLIMHVPIIIMILILVKKVKKIPFNTIPLRKISMIMYYTHMLVLALYYYLIEKKFLDLKIESIKTDLLLLISSILLSLALYKLLELKRKKVIK